MKNADMPAMPNALAQPTNDGYLSTEGLTKREHFAGLALSGLLSNDEAVNRIASGAEENLIGPQAAMATVAVSMADALLAELENSAS